MSAITNTVLKTEGRVVPWNKGKLLGQKPPLKLKEIWAVRIRLQLDHRTRELALFNLAIDSLRKRATVTCDSAHTPWRISRIDLNEYKSNRRVATSP